MSRRNSGGPAGGAGAGRAGTNGPAAREREQTRGGAYLVGPKRPGQTSDEIEAHLEELAALVDTAGFSHLGEAVLPLRQIQPATLIGSGQAEDVGLMARGLGAEVVVVDDDLSPAQVRNLERIVDLPVVDRAGVIIEIFAQHARSREARTQVELARLEYLLPRLAGRWSHLSRQVGGGPGGTKGEGEKQIELDRRMIRRQIDRLKRELRRIDRGREVRRSGRVLPQIALVGYTNVGKSSLFNRLSGAGVRVEDQLFATLDPTVRRIELGKRGVLLAKDTVGFVRKLPHHLVASFRSTFQEAADSDLVVLVADASHPAFDEQYATSLAVLEDSNLGSEPRLLLLNKIDRLGVQARAGLAKRYPEALLVSARTGEGLDSLLDTLSDRLLGRELTETLDIPTGRSDVVAAAHRLGSVETCEQVDGVIRLTLRATGSVFSRIEQSLHGRPRERGR